MDASEILFHPSSLGDLMTGTGKEWKPVKESVTCKRKLIEIFIQHTTARTPDRKGNKYTEKGNLQENDAITLYSRFTKEPYKKNKQRFINKYFTGEPDIIKPSGNTVDTKCAWSIFTMPNKLVDSIDSDYENQGHGYMDLLNSSNHTVAHCLVNNPAKQILKAQETLYYEMECPDDDNQQFIEKKIQIEINMIFDMAQFKRDNPYFDLTCTDWKYDLPISERIVEFSFDRSDEAIKKIYKRLDECRAWMDENLFKTPLIMLADHDTETKTIIVQGE